MSESTAMPADAVPRGETVCVLGLGYVGLPLGLAFDSEGFDVLGYDVDEEWVSVLDGGDDPTGDHGTAAIRDSDIEFTTDSLVIERADYVVITVPTPVDDLGNPDLSFVENAGRTVGEHLSEGTTVVLESTVYPGVTREVLVPAIEDRSGLRVGEGFSVGYSPERLSPGEEGRGLRDVTKIVSGGRKDTLRDLAALYETVVEAGVYRAPSIETAEAAKVIENVQRDLNIALVNELALMCDHLELDTDEVLAAAESKWNFHGYAPGLVGGHCIPVDPMYLAHGSERAGFTPDLILTGREVNEYMPKHTAEMLLRALNDSGKVLSESRVVVLGLAYKPNVGDIRTSEVQGVVAELERYDVTVVGHDPHADDDAVREQFDIPTCETPDYDGADGVLLATPHDEYRDLDLDAVATALDDDPVLVDLMGVYSREEAGDAGLRYRKL